MYQILICEDQKEVRTFIKDYFETKDIKIIEAWNGEEALMKLNHNIDLVLLDIMMPGINGYEVCKQIRETSQVPIIIISALSEEENQLKGYELGADDYMTKPFKPSLLYAKVIAILKRNSLKKEEIITTGHIKLNTYKHELMIDHEYIQLTKKEYALLEYFINHQGMILTREQLLNNIWGYDYFGDGRAVDTYVKRIRKHLGKYSDYIQTVIRVGYMMEVKDEEDT